MDYCDPEWFALEMNRAHSVVFETASKYWISDSFVGYEVYSISSKGFLPTVQGSERHLVMSDSLLPSRLYTVHGILRARILEWAAFPFSRGASNPGIKPRSPTLQADSLPAEPQGSPRIL